MSLRKIFGSLGLTCVCLNFAYAEKFPIGEATVDKRAAQKMVKMATIPLADAQRLQAIYEERIQHLNDHHRPTPSLRELRSLPRVPDVLPQPAATLPLAASNDIQIVARKELKGAELGNTAGVICEPSVARSSSGAVLITGNWFTSFSPDGNDFSFVSPFTTFGNDSAGRGFCCDQVAMYNPSHDMMIWFLQYSRDVNHENSILVAVATGADITAGNWHPYELTPKAINPNWGGEWFDYPDLSMSDDHLYITSNMFSENFTRAVVLQLPLKAMALKESLNIRFFDTQQFGSLRPTQGSTGKVYFGTHEDRRNLQVFIWDEEENSIRERQVPIQEWHNNARISTTPSGVNWLGRTGRRITAAWESGSTLGFAWSSSKGGGFDQPNVRVAIVDKATMKAVNQPHIFHSQMAFAYPAASVNADGRVGLSICYGGGGKHPSHAIGLLKADRSAWTLVARREGTGSVTLAHSQKRNVWGDYLAVRPSGNADGFVASGYTLQGSTLEVTYTEFRPDGGSPPPSNGISRNDLVNLRSDIDNAQKKLQALIDKLDSQ